MQKSQPKLICATMGKNGSKAYYNGESVFSQPFLRNDTIETTGAGDTFMACVLNAVLENGLEQLSHDNLADMLRFANAFQDDIEQSMNAGMNEHITKPIDLKRLINTIHSLVKQKKFNLVVDKSI